MNLKFDTLEGMIRPTILVNGIKIVIDIGAEVPVWCAGIKRFCIYFPDAKKHSIKYILSGFGRTQQELQVF